MTLIVNAVPLLDYTTAGRPSPSIDVELSGVTGNYVTIWRYWDGKRVELRGAFESPVLGGSMFFTDWEAPFGVPIAYQASTFALNGANIESAQSNSATLDVPLCEVWMSAPLAPTVAAKVSLNNESLTSYSRKRSGGTVGIQGSPTPVAVVGTRGIASGFSVVLLLQSAADFQAAMAVLEQADPFLLRGTPEPTTYTLPPLAYCTTDDFRPVFITRQPGTFLANIVMAVDLVAPPAIDIVVEPRTCLDVLIENTTCADVLANYATCLALLRG